jgi:FkbM family methyltransferase
MDIEYIEDQIFDANQTCSIISWGSFQHGKILDLGASLGYFTKKILDFSPKSSVLAVEPNKKIFDFLVQNVSDLNVICLNAAVTNGETKILFYENDNPSQGSTFLSEYLKDRQQINTKEYMVHGIDFRKLLSIYQPNLIKIDIEGYELFLDFSNLPLSVNTIFMEVHLQNTNEFGEPLPGTIDNGLELYTKIIQTLFEQGFEYVKLPSKTKDNLLVEFPFNGTWDGSDRTHLVCLKR